MSKQDRLSSVATVKKRFSTFSSMVLLFLCLYCCDLRLRSRCALSAVSCPCAWSARKRFIPCRVSSTTWCRPWRISRFHFPPAFYAPSPNPFANVITFSHHSARPTLLIPLTSSAWNLVVTNAWYALNAPAIGTTGTA